MKTTFLFIAIISLFVLSPSVNVLAQEGQSPDQGGQVINTNEAVSAPYNVETEYYKGEVKEVLDEDTIDVGGFIQPYQDVSVEIIDGPDAGDNFEHQYQLPQSATDSQKLRQGDRVVVVKVIRGEQTEFYVAEEYRLPAVLWIFVFFFALAIIFAGKKGFTAIVGLGFSLLIIVKFIVPQIADGKSPLIVSLIGSFLILLISLYLAHGYNKRTTVALTGTSITLILSALLAIGSVSFARLFGLGSEEALALLQGQFSNINLQGLLLGGIIIGALGVLDDVTTAQSATVDEIHRANPKLPASELYKRGLSVGKEHIASLINTLALAYVGASLPLMLVFTKTDFPLWVTLNSEFLVEEIMRTLIGSMALILAVPITTYIAARAFAKDKVDHKSDQPIYHSH